MGNLQGRAGAKSYIRTSLYTVKKISDFYQEFNPPERKAQDQIIRGTENNPFFQHAIGGFF
jgi:hypothetical protein